MRNLFGIFALLATLAGCGDNECWTTVVAQHAGPGLLPAPATPATPTTPNAPPVDPCLTPPDLMVRLAADGPRGGQISVGHLPAGTGEHTGLIVQVSPVYAAGDCRPATLRAATAALEAVSWSAAGRTIRTQVGMNWGAATLPAGETRTGSTGQQVWTATAAVQNVAELGHGTTTTLTVAVPAGPAETSLGVKAVELTVWYGGQQLGYDVTPTRVATYYYVP